MNSSLVKKYNVPGPRYTSYPTVPFWEENGITIDNWKNSLKSSFNESNKDKGISIYIHLPFCESLCTFCACHKHITKRHEVETPYIRTLLKEWQLYLNLFEEKPVLRELHLGGGTPTFFSSANLEYLIKGILKTVEFHKDYEFSFEGHPNNTSIEHLKTLYDLGFTRVSFGVQDYNKRVQKAINRIQPFENVENVTLWAREIGYASISHDLVFGLPFQNVSDIIETIKKTDVLRPGRISFYGYAHVPWLKGVGQRGFSDEDIPKGNEKRILYEIGKYMLEDLGYIEIGMDHFALPSDSLCQAFKMGDMHRNFMGYTTNKTIVMVGLGMSSISDSWYSFAQNEKSLKDYQEKVESGQLPIMRGHLLSDEDIVIRKHILNIMCHFRTSWEEDKMKFEKLPEVLERLKEMESDNIICIRNNELIVHEQGKAYVRNICMAFDLRLLAKKPVTQMFSMTI